MIPPLHLDFFEGEKIMKKEKDTKLKGKKMKIRIRELKKCEEKINGVCGRKRSERGNCC